MKSFINTGQTVNFYWFVQGGGHVNPCTYIIYTLRSCFVFVGNVISLPSNKSLEEPFQESIRPKHFCTKRSVEQCPGDWNSESVSSFSTNEPVIDGIGSHRAKPIPVPRQKLDPFNEGMY